MNRRRFLRKRPKPTEGQRDREALAREIVRSDDYYRKCAYRTEGTITEAAFQAIRAAARKSRYAPRSQPEEFVLDVAIRSGYTPEIVRHARMVMVNVLAEELDARYTIDWRNVDL